MSEQLTKFYVATNGDDTWSGLLDAANADGTDGPFLTLARARDAVRQLKVAQGGGLIQAVEVLVRGGTYHMDEPLRISGGDSGTAQFPVTYAAYPGETPIVSGGRPITGWQPYKGEVLCAKLPDTRKGLWSFRQLFYKGKRMIRARYPKYDPADPLYGGWAFVDHTVSEDPDHDGESKVEYPVAFRYEADIFPNKWAKPQQAEVFIISGRGWISDIIPLKEVDYENHVMHVTRPVGPARNTLGMATHIEGGNRFYVENNIEDLTEPGEWCLDTDTGTLYFWPPDGDIESAEVAAPATGRLIQMIGSRSTPVSHVTFHGFTLTQTQAQYPTPESYYKTPNAGQTVYMQDTEDCGIEDNFFDAVGGDAVRLQNNNARNRIVGNHIADIGAYGIFVGSFQRGFCRHDPVSGDVPTPSLWYTQTEDRDTVIGAWPRSGGHLISNNHIHDIGYFEKHANGIAFFGVSAPDVVVSHNLIHHGPRFGIGLMSGFGRVIIEYNDLHHLSMETCDTGGITVNRWYTYAKDPDLCRGNIIRFNCVHDVVGCGAYEKKMESGGGKAAGGRIWTPYYSWAVYFDNGPIDVLVYGNITARNTIGGIMVSHYAQNVTIENNIFIDSDKSQVYLLLHGDTTNVRFKNNIFSYSNPDADYMRVNMGPQIDAAKVLVEHDYNLYSPPPGKPPTFSGLPGEATVRTGTETKDQIDTSMDAWKAMGFDAHSVVADPKFVDPANDNYDLQPDSPALKLGFKPIDASRIGLLPRGSD